MCKYSGCPERCSIPKALTAVAFEPLSPEFVCVWEGLHANSSDIAKLNPPISSEIPPVAAHWQLCQGVGPGEPLSPLQGRL